MPYNVTNTQTAFSSLNRSTQEQKSFTSVGVDGCKGGWAAVSITDQGFEVALYKTIEEICSIYSESDSILIDMPIGLPESTDEIRPEAEARKILSGRASCVFNVPCRQSIYTEGYFEANVINKQVLGKGISKQSFAICKNIKEIDQFLEKEPGFKEKIKESHPEICFAMLQSAGEHKVPIHESKHTKEGQFKRIGVLTQYYDGIDEFVQYVQNRPKLSKLSEDCIDALCLAVTGRLGLRNGFRSVPERPMRDSRGIMMQMIYAHK